MSDEKSGKEFATLGVELAEALSPALSDLSFAVDTDVAELSRPVSELICRYRELACAAGASKAAGVCDAMLGVVARVCGNAALAKPSIIGVLKDAAGALESLAASPAAAARVDVSRLLFQLELARGPSKARH